MTLIYEPCAEMMLKKRVISDVETKRIIFRKNDKNNKFRIKIDKKEQFLSALIIFNDWYIPIPTGKCVSQKN